MIASWMLYASVVTACFCVAAVALERSVRFAGRPARWIVGAAMLGSVLVPLLARSAPASVDTGMPGGLLPSSVEYLAPLSAMIPGRASFPSLDVPLAVCWIGLSLVLFAIVALTHLQVTRKIKQYPKEKLGGSAVLRSPVFGPAVVGLFKGSIVLPIWADDVRREWRELMVLHEQEHLRGRDGPVLFSALLLVILLPWNLPLWYLLVRLRRAIELDCDQRVLGSGVDVRDYGHLLIDVSRRRVRSPLPVIGLALNRSFLAQRVDAMTQNLSCMRYPRALAAVALGGVFVAVACELPTPVEPNENVHVVPQEIREVTRHARAILKVSVDDSLSVAVAIRPQLEDLQRLHRALDIYAVANESTLVRVPEELAERMRSGKLLMIASEQDGEPVVLLKKVRERLRDESYPEPARDSLLT